MTSGVHNNGTTQVFGFDSNLTEKLMKLSDDELQATIEGIPADRLLEIPGQPWHCDVDLFERILKFCDAERARILLFVIIAKYSEAALYSALRIMDQPDRLGVFINALKESRDLFFDRIYVPDLIKNQFLPTNIQKILQNENRIFLHKRLSISENDRQKLIASVDAEHIVILEEAIKAAEKKAEHQKIIATLRRQTQELVP